MRLAYLIATSPATLDPRVPIVQQVRATKGAATTWRSLGGRWAVPGLMYADGIERHHNAILALPDGPGAEKGPNGMPDALAKLTTRQSLLPASASNWGHATMRGGWPSYITIHETGNRRVGANAEMHRKFVHSGGGEHEVSFHAVVDSKESIQLMPWNWVAWHTSDGSGDGNFDSIAIENCQNADGDFAATIRNLAALVAKLMREFDIPLANVVQHNHWARDKKNCPEFMRANNQALWKGLLAAVAALTKAPAPRPEGWLGLNDADVFKWEGEGVITYRKSRWYNPEKGRWYEREWSHDTGFGPWKEIA